MAAPHQPVLLQEVVALLRPSEGKVIVDGTLGAGGHAEALLEKGARVVGLDRDPRALALASQRLSTYGDRFTPVAANFGDALPVLEGLGALPVDGLLVDLGVSSMQLDQPARGFSFQKEGPLDMRMGDDGPTAAELIAQSSEADLARWLRELGEEPFARPIARSLKALRPATTLEAAKAVESAVPRRAWPKKIHVATRTFQALRMAVNRELEALDALLSALPNLLKVGGRAAVIAFHSLEDRKVKQAFAARLGRCTCPPGLPVCACGRRGDFALVTKGAVQAGDEEIARNVRARSARLRAVEKVR